MNIILSQISTYSTSTTTHFLKSAARSLTITSSWKNTLISPITINNNSSLGFARCYSTKKNKPKKFKMSTKAKMKDDEKDAFYVVRKGDVVGVYKNFAECQAQVGNSVSDPPVSVFKGYSLPKDAEKHLASHGLQNALYTIKASDLKQELFGKLVNCPIQEASPMVETSSAVLPQKRPYDSLDAATEGAAQWVDASSKLFQSTNVVSDKGACVLEFDGASKGNPGPAGAGAVLRTVSGKLICNIRQGLGIATNNAAEYRAVILGLKKAIQMGYTSIRAQGDSKLVCMQLQGLWRVKHQNVIPLHTEANKLKDRFSSFEISHVLRELNSAADEQANLGVNLADGQEEVEFA